jgi:hypothetical protein
MPFQSMMLGWANQHSVRFGKQATSQMSTFSGSAENTILHIGAKSDEDSALKNHLTMELQIVGIGPKQCALWHNRDTVRIHNSARLLRDLVRNQNPIIVCD